MSARVGRPPIPPEQRLVAQLRVQATESEEDAVFRLAIKADKSVSAFLRGYLERALPEVFRAKKQDAA